MKKLKIYSMPILLALVSLVCLWDISSSRNPAATGLAFPKIMAILLLASSISLAIKILIKSKSSGIEPEEKDNNNSDKLVVTILPLLLLFLGYIILMNILGFFISTPIFVFLCAKRFNISTISAIILALIFSVIIYVLFVRVLFVPFPSGISIFKTINELIIY